MIRGNRIRSMFVLLGLLVSGLAPAARSQSDTSTEASAKTFTISGTIGLTGVTLMGFPGVVQTDETGTYSVELQEGWKGTVKPVKIGYGFEPPSRQYTQVVRNYEKEDYKASILTFTISGNVGTSGVVMQGLPDNPTTDSAGRYSVQVPYGWAGKVVPTKSGFVFTPAYRQYAPLHANSGGQDYTTKIIEFTISGSAGVPGVTMRGLTGRPVVTDSKGDYQVLLAGEWSGTITPEKEGHLFDPPSRTYTQVQKDQMNQDYAVEVLTFRISGHAGAPGVLMRGLPGEPVTDQQGRYATEVPCGWSGIVGPEKRGYTFTPGSRTYSHVTTSMTEENYAPEEGMITISNVVSFGGEPIQGVTVHAKPGGYTAVTDHEGRYRIAVPPGWSGRLTMSKPGFEFVGQIEYRNVTVDIINGKSVPAAEDWPPLPSGVPQASAPIPSGDVLVIPTADVMPEKVAETTEDLRVMLQILHERLNEPRMILGVLRDYGSFFGDDRKAEALYLQGTAAVFVIKMDFPYSFPAQQPAEDETRQEAADPVWQRARQKLYSPGGARNSSPSGQTQTMTFEQFKEELLRSLKHTANLRHIDPNELVILTLVARSEDTSRTGEADLMKQYANIYGSDYMAMMGIGRPALSTTVLTMQAKKADIDAFAKGELDFEQFQQKVKTFVY